MFERGDRIIGIYKVYDCTHNVVLDPKKAEKQFKKVNFFYQINFFYK